MFLIKMDFKYILAFLICLITKFKAAKVCYDELGCFVDTYPYGQVKGRYFSLLPQSPDNIETSFVLYNRNLNGSHENINHTYLGENFITNVSTKVLIHGFLQSGNRTWLINMKNEILSVENVNVIIVDWFKGGYFPYEQAVANTLVVGAEIARLTQAFIESNRTNAQSFHLIGMSLGAHVAGYVGERIRNLGRITGLDPAGLYFENTDSVVRLDENDALFVDVIHTDSPTSSSLGFGIIQPSGHVDFYVNGGYDQPGCRKMNDRIVSAFFDLVMQNTEAAKRTLVCNHLIVIDYFIDSIRDKCVFTGYPCKSLTDFEKGECLKCSKKGCNVMGYWASPNLELGTLYLNTVKENSCIKNILVRLFSVDEKQIKNLLQAKGKFSIIFEGLNKNSSSEVLDNAKTTFRLSSIEARRVSISGLLPDEVVNVYVNYETSNSVFNWLYNDKWKFKKIELYDSENNKTYTFRPVIEDIAEKFSKYEKFNE